MFTESITSAATGILPVAEFQKSPALPAEWRLQTYKGTPSFSILPLGEQPHLRMMSRGETAYGFKREVVVDMQTYPHLSWSWKATELPVGGDVRQADKDDQAIQIYVVFNESGKGLLAKPHTLAYIWDNEAPKNIQVKSPQAMLGNVKYLVLRNKSDVTGKWLAEKRNVQKDFTDAFGHPGVAGKSPKIKGMLLFINTHHTKSTAEGNIGNIFFSKE